METVSIRVDNLKQLDTFKKVLNENRSGVIRALVEEGKKLKALELYRIGKVSLGLAARLSGLTLSEFIDLLRVYNMTLQLDCDDVKLALEHARKLM